MKLKEKQRKRFAEYIPYAGFIGEGIADGLAITKQGFLLRTYRYSLKDLSFVFESEIVEVFKSLNNCFSFFRDGGWALYLDSFRGALTPIKGAYETTAPEAARIFDRHHQKALGGFHASEHYLTLCYNPYAGSKVDSMFFSRRGQDDLLGALYHFVEVTDDIFGMLTNTFGYIKSLDNDETMTFYHRCVSPSPFPHAVRTPEIPFYLDYYLSDALFTPDVNTMLDDFHVHTLTIHDFPAETRPDMVTALMASDISFRYSLRFLFTSREETRKKIKGSRRAHYQKRKGLLGVITEAVSKEETALEDTEAIMNTQDSSEALSTLASGDMYFGKVTSTIVVMDRSWAGGKERIKGIKKIINNHGYICKEETFNNPLAYLGTLHGNVDYNPRSPLISTQNLCHLFPLSEPWQGDFANEHLGGISGVNDPHMVARFGASQFYLNLNVGDVGHTLVVGPTGAGKSIFLAAAALQFFRYPGAKIIFFDKDGSSRHACKNVGGKFLDIGSESCEYLLNPFADLSDASHRIWLGKFFGEFFRMKGLNVGPKEEHEIYVALESMAETALDVSELSFRRFQQEIQQDAIRLVLGVFADGGEFSQFFAPVKDDIIDAPWVTYELGTLMEMDESIIKFILGYLFQRTTLSFTGSPVLLVVDEAWIFLDNEFFAGMLRDWLKTLRKKNVYVILASQEMADINTSISSTIANACMSKIFLPNNQALQSENRRLYHDLGLSEDDLEVLVGARPKCEYLYASPRGKQLFELCLDGHQLKILQEEISL